MNTFKQMAEMISEPMKTLKQFAEMISKEKDNYLKMQKLYIEEIEKLPKGNIVIKKRKGKKQPVREYFYLHYYCNDKKCAIDEYLGKEAKAISSLKTQIDKRRQLETKLKKLEEDFEKGFKPLQDELGKIEKMVKIANFLPKQKGVRKDLKITQENSDTTPPNQPEIFKTLPSPTQETNTHKK